MNIPQALEATYRNAYYCVSAPKIEFILQVGHISEEAAKLMAEFSAQGALFVTAFNPFGQVLSAEENENANALLKSELQAFCSMVLPGYGSSPDASWREESFFAFPASRSMATEFCCRHAQNAVLFVDADGIAQLVFHPDIDPPSK